MPAGDFDPDQPDSPPISFFEFINRTVNLALQAHGVWSVEASETIGEIVQVAEELAKTNPGDFRKSVFDIKKMSAVDREAIIRAIAIYKAVAAELFGMTYAQIEKKIDKYAKEFGDA